MSDLELASRLSFFLWSSIPDDQLLTLAERRKLSDPKVLDQQVKRMLADPRSSEALVNDFAAQWLNLRRVAEVVVDPERYPNYDLTLMDAFKRETELFVGSTLREDRSVLELLNADYTFVNEKLARHYGIPGIYGSRFRRVSLPDKDRRGGLLGAGRVVVDDVVSGSHVAGSSRKIPAEQHLRAADAAAAAWRRYESCAGEAGRGARRPSASGLPNTAPIRRARAATASSIRSGLRSRTSTSSAAGAPSTRPASLSMRRARR